MRKGLSFAEFSKLLEGCSVSPGEKLGVGVSGGPDSMALLMLLSKCLPKSIHAIVVDHKIRSNSTEEAHQVKRIIESKDIPCSIYTIDWGGNSPTSISSSKLEDTARSHRYLAFSKACQEWNLQKLFLGHHQNDLTETILFRLTRGTGVSGFAPMLPQSYFPFVPFPKAISLQLCRPLLSIPKQRLIDTCIEMDVPYINDPMNMDLVFQRNRIRALLKNPPHPQFDEATTAQIMQHFYEYGKASLELTRKLILENVIADPQSGTLFLSLPPLKNENKNHWMHEPSIANTVLGSLIRWVMCTNFSPSLQSLEGLRNFICNYRPQQNPSHHCIHQTLVFAPRPLHNGSTNWIFLRSAPSQKDRHQKILPLLQLGEPLLFDDRFFVTRIKPPAQHSSPHLKSFYESLSKFLPTNIHLGETHELVVRHFHKNDELTLSTILNRRHRHTALIQYTRAYEHFKFKMPYRGRYALLVIALREKKDKWTNDHEESKLGQLIAIPSLGIHFMPSYFGFHVEYRQPLTRTLGISQTEENRDKKNLSLT